MAWEEARPVLLMNSSSDAGGKHEGSGNGFLSLGDGRVKECDGRSRSRLRFYDLQSGVFHGWLPSPGCHPRLKRRLGHNSGSWLKVEIALARGKKIYDKREDIKNREAKRDMGRISKLQL